MEIKAESDELISERELLKVKKKRKKSGRGKTSWCNHRPSSVSAPRCRKRRDSTETAWVLSEESPEDLVWANLRSGVMHLKDWRYYCATQYGQLLSRQEASEQGYRLSTNGQ